MPSKIRVRLFASLDQAYNSLDGKKRVVLTKQCEGVNAKLMVLKAIINNGPRDPTRSELQEIHNARGDELAVWNEEEEPSSESSDEDKGDDDNAGARAIISSTSSILWTTTKMTTSRKLQQSLSHTNRNFSNETPKRRPPRATTLLLKAEPSPEETKLRAPTNHVGNQITQRTSAI